MHNQTLRLSKCRLPDFGLRWLQLGALYYMSFHLQQPKETISNQEALWPVASQYIMFTANTFFDLNSILYDI